jgi:flagellar hook-basal body complex protein FliE
MSVIDPRITVSQVVNRGLDTMLHSDALLDEAVSESSFADILNGVLGTANTTDADAHANIGTMMTGDYDPDVVMTASVKAELALTLVVQVRDRALEAYNQIMQMQV